jgi:hypothetical protein
MNPMNLQQAFSVIWTHAQKRERSTEAIYKSRCLYFGPENRNCFLGALMPKEWSKSEDIEALNAEEVRTRLVGHGILSEEISAHSITRLQCIHDKDDPEEWNARLRKFATEHNLIVEE